MVLDAADVADVSVLAAVREKYWEIVRCDPTVELESCVRLKIEWELK